MQAQTDRIIEMAWEDRTPFEAIAGRIEHRLKLLLFSSVYPKRK